MERFAVSAGLAAVRYSPLLALPGLSPFAWAPASIRVVLLMALSLGMALLAPVAIDAPVLDGARWVAAVGSELVVGLCLAFAVLVPLAAVSFFGRVIDVQAGFGAAALLNPAASAEGEALIGMALNLLFIALFFALDLHQDLLRFLVASVTLVPLGSVVHLPEPASVAAALSIQFALAVVVVAPVLIGLFVIDVSVAYSTRSMPQANVFFLSLPVKIAAALALLALSLRAAPELVSRMFGRSMSDSLQIMGG